MKDAADAQKTKMDFKRRPETMPCDICHQEEFRSALVLPLEATVHAWIASTASLTNATLQLNVPKLDDPRCRHSGTTG